MEATANVSTRQLVNWSIRKGAGESLPSGKASLHARVLFIACILLPPVTGSAGEPLRQISAVLHAHSTWSSGDQSLDELAARARAVGVEAVFLAENHLQRFEYGLWPLRGLLRYRIEYPSLLSRGPAEFLQAVREANARHPDVLLIPGAEIIPAYYWTGSLFDGSLTMHDGQKNLLAFGLARPEDYRELPAVGNPGAARWSRESLWHLSPLLLAFPGIWLLRLRRRRVIRFQRFQATVERRFTAYGILCLLIMGLLLANNFPFRVAPVSPYDPDAGLGPHQAVIDFINAHGGLAVWSLPEAKDYQVITAAGFRATIQTQPYPADLLRTDRFTAFGGVYEDTTTFTNPGGDWDQLLLAFLAGRRAAPAWAIGEAAYHREGQAGKRFGDIQTVLLAERRDAAALLHAVRSGRMYARQRTRDEGLILDRFQVVAPGQSLAEAGGRLAVRPGDRPEVRATIRTATGRALWVEARLVRAGTIVHEQRGETPLSLHWTDRALPPGASLFYRLEVRGPAPHQILSNPIFVPAARGDGR